MKDRIKAVRKSLGLNQTEFANALGISFGAVQSYEIGRREPTSSFISLICEKYNVRREWLENGTGDMHPPDSDDQDAAYLEELLGSEDNPLYEIIKATMKTYMDLDSKDQDIIKNFAKSLIKETKEP